MPEIRDATLVTPASVVPVAPAGAPFTEEDPALDGAVVTGAGYGSSYSFTVASGAALAGPDEAPAAIGEYLTLLAQAHGWPCAHLSAWRPVWARPAGRGLQRRPPAPLGSRWPAGSRPPMRPPPAA